MKGIIIYSSIHHGNTKKLIDAAKEKFNVDTVNVKDCKNGLDLGGYDTVGFASGIYMGKQAAELLRIARENAAELSGKNLFAIITSGSKSSRYEKDIRKQFDLLSLELTQLFHCKGFDTFGPWKYIGGIAKGHPDETDIEHLVSFIKSNKLLDETTDAG